MNQWTSPGMSLVNATMRYSVGLETRPMYRVRLKRLSPALVENHCLQPQQYGTTIHNSGGEGKGVGYYAWRGSRRISMKSSDVKCITRIGLAGIDRYNRSVVQRTGKGKETCGHSCWKQLSHARKTSVASAQRHRAKARFLQYVQAQHFAR